MVMTAVVLDLGYNVALRLAFESTELGFEWLIDYLLFHPRSKATRRFVMTVVCTVVMMRWHSRRQKIRRYRHRVIRRTFEGLHTEPMVVSNNRQRQRPPSQIPTLMELSRKQLRYNLAHNALGYPQPTVPIGSTDQFSNEALYGDNESDQRLVQAPISNSLDLEGLSTIMYNNTSRPWRDRLTLLYAWCKPDQRTVKAGELLSQLRSDPHTNLTGWSVKFDEAVSRLKGKLPFHLVESLRLPEPPLPPQLGRPPFEVLWQAPQHRHLRLSSGRFLALILTATIWFLMVKQRRRSPNRASPLYRRISMRPLSCLGDILRSCQDSSN